MFAALYHQAHQQGNQWVNLAWPARLTLADLDAVATAPALPDARQAILSNQAQADLARLYTMAGIELTIRFERMIVHHLGLLLQHWTRPEDHALRACIAQFIAEESLHAETFGRYLQEVDPHRYGQGPHHFLPADQPRPKAAAAPSGLLTILFLEDLFLHGQHPDMRHADSWLAELTRRHVLDESRHTRINRALVQHVFGQMGAFKQGMHLLLTLRCLHQAAQERQALLNAVVSELIAAHGELRPHEEALRSHLAGRQLTAHAVAPKVLQLLRTQLEIMPPWPAAIVLQQAERHLPALTAFVA